MNEQGETQLELERRQAFLLTRLYCLVTPQAGLPAPPRARAARGWKQPVCRDNWQGRRPWGVRAPLSCLQVGLPLGWPSGRWGRRAMGGPRETALPFWMTAQPSLNFFSQPLAPGPKGSVREKAWSWGES